MKENKRIVPQKLTPKQALFVIEYLKDLNGTQAAIRAGYSEDTAGSIGHENLKKPEIQEAIEKQMEYRAKRTLITADYVLSSMKEVAERCLQRKPVMVFDHEEKCMKQKLDENGEGIWEFDSAGANKALENLARNQKLLTDKSEIGNADGSNIGITQLVEVFVDSPESAIKLSKDNVKLTDNLS